MGHDDATDSDADRTEDSQSSAKSYALPHSGETSRPIEADAASFIDVLAWVLGIWLVVYLITTVYPVLGRFCFWLEEINVSADTSVRHFNKESHLVQVSSPTCQLAMRNSRPVKAWTLAIVFFVMYGVVARKYASSTRWREGMAHRYHGLRRRVTKALDLAMLVLVLFQHSSTMSLALFTIVGSLTVLQVATVSYLVAQDLTALFDEGLELGTIFLLFAAGMAAVSVWSHHAIPDVKLTLAKSAHEPGMRRFKWTCNCGKPLSGRYHIQRQSDAERLQAFLASLNNGSTDKAPLEQLTGPSERSDASGTSGIASTGPHNPLHDRQGASAVTPGAPGASSASVRSLPHRAPAFFELCVRRNSRLTRLGEVTLVDSRGQMTVRSDSQLFGEFSMYQVEYF